MQIVNFDSKQVLIFYAKIGQSICCQENRRYFAENWSKSSNFVNKTLTAVKKYLNIFAILVHCIKKNLATLLPVPRSPRDKATIDHKIPDGPSVSTSVTRLGEFSPLGCLFTLGRLLKMIKVAQIVGLLFFLGNSCALILTTMGWVNTYKPVLNTYICT
jgi:hypothetical protein